MAIKYRLKKKVGGYLALTSATYGRIIKDGEELELDAVELERLKEYVEPVPRVIKKKKEEERVIEITVEDDK